MQYIPSHFEGIFSQQQQHVKQIGNANTKKMQSFLTQAGAYRLLDCCPLLDSESCPWHCTGRP
eukprot:scaffold110775_cov42-Prasinocladus_malaysianus.AAC.1